MNRATFKPTALHKRMQLFFVFVFFLFAFTRSSKAENESDLLSSVDIIVLGYSQQVSQRWDCPRISDRAENGEEARVWRMVIPDARIEEKAIASASRTLRIAKKYKWTKDNMLSSGSTTAKSNSFVQNSVLLGMRKPNFDGGAAPLKLLYSESKQVNQDALSALLSQLEQSKNKIMDWMAAHQASLPVISTAPNITDPLTDHRLQVPQALNYHPRVFRHAHFTTGDLIAWMAIAAESRQKGHTDAFKFFKIMVQAFLPGFDINIGAVPRRYAGKPTKTIYLHRSFQHVPAGADLAFYFDGNRGNFLSLQGDAVVLSRPEGVVDGQQRAALVLSSNANADASNLKMHHTNADIMQKAFREALERAFALSVSAKATDAELQAVGVSTIRSLAARLEYRSFLEAQRKLLEAEPKLLSELLPEELVRLVIAYFNDDTYLFIVSTHNWTLRNINEIAVDSARLYVLTGVEGLKGLKHSLANTKEDRRHLIEFGDPRGYNYWRFSSSHDGRYVFFRHSNKALIGQGDQPKSSTRWLTQSNELEDEKPKRIAFDGEDLPYGSLSRDGQTLCSYNFGMDPIIRVYQVREDAGKDPIGLMKFKLNGEVLAVSGKGNRVMMVKGERLEIHDIGKDASKLVCETAMIFGYICALNKDGSEAACVTCDGELRIIEVDKIADDVADPPAVVTVKAPKSMRLISKLVYTDGGNLHVLHSGNKVSLFDPSTKEFILLEAPQEGQVLIRLAISSNAEYIAILLGLGKSDELGMFKKHRTIVKRKAAKSDWEDLFGCEAEEGK